VLDHGNVPAPVVESVELRDHEARYLPEVKATCERIALLVDDAVRGGAIPLVLGGDHSVGLGTLGGMWRVHGPGGVLWIDAHGDLNTPQTSPSGNVHGMVLAAAIGLGDGAFETASWSLPLVDPGRIALVGVRSLDDGERARLRELDAKIFTMSEVDRLGLERCVRESLTHIAGPGFVHVSLDMDVVDPAYAPGVGTPVRGGLSYREAHLAMELVAESGLAGSLEVVEVNPILDRENETASLAVELVASALGATIL
jgi:arginase